MDTTWIRCQRYSWPETFMKIDLLITELEPGGAERCCAALARYAQQQNHGVRVISLGPRPTPGKDRLVRLLEDEKISLHFLNASSRTPPWLVRSRLLALVRSNRPDVAQGFLWHANWIGASVYPKLSVPFFAGVRVTEPRRWRAWLSRFWIRKSRKIICVSRDVADWCHRIEGAPRDQLVVIPNGIEPADFSQPANDPRLSSSDRVLLFVGRLTEQKGIDTLMRWAPHLLKELPEHQLVILGDGPLKASLEHQRSKMTCSDRIAILGRVDSVHDWMAHAEILLHPARYEGMPNAVLEAMAHGLPIAAFRVEGIEELLGNTTDPQTVPKEDWSGWVNRVIEIGHDRELRKNLGSANRTRAETNFRLEDQLARYLALWSGSFVGA
jgi:starch synthase (maltosyl-transferring)